MKAGQIWSAPENLITLDGAPATKDVGIRVVSVDPIRQVAHLELVKDPWYKASIWLAHPQYAAEIATWTLIEDVP